MFEPALWKAFDRKEQNKIKTWTHLESKVKFVRANCTAESDRETVKSQTQVVTPSPTEEEEDSTEEEDE